MRPSMPCPRRNRPAKTAGANHPACTMFLALWGGAKIECFGVCRTYAAARPEARCVPEPFAWRLPEEPIRKRAFRNSRPDTHAVCGKGHAARIILGNGVGYEALRLLHSGRNVA